MGAWELDCRALDETVTLGRALVFAASGVIPGRAPPDPSTQKSPPTAFKVLQWLLNMSSPALSKLREPLSFPFHMCGLTQATGDLLGEALCGRSPHVLHLLVQFVCENNFQARARWARANLAAVRSHPPQHLWRPVRASLAVSLIPMFCRACLSIPETAHA